MAWAPDGDTDSDSSCRHTQDMEESEGIEPPRASSARHRFSGPEPSRSANSPETWQMEEELNLHRLLIRFPPSRAMPFRSAILPSNLEPSEGVEPPTCCLRDSRSRLLSYKGPVAGRGFEPLSSSL